MEFRRACAFPRVARRLTGERDSAFDCNAAKGRGIKATPNGPPVMLWTFSVTSWIAIATPQVVIARFSASGTLSVSAPMASAAPPPSAKSANAFRLQAFALGERSWVWLAPSGGTSSALSRRTIKSRRSPLRSGQCSSSVAPATISARCSGLSSSGVCGARRAPPSRRSFRRTTGARRVAADRDDRCVAGVHSGGDAARTSRREDDRLAIYQEKGPRRDSRDLLRVSSRTPSWRRWHASSKRSIRARRKLSGREVIGGPGHPADTA